MSQQLQTGQFYGNVAQRCMLHGFVLSEVHHKMPRRVPEHSHNRVFVSVLLDGAYQEQWHRHRVVYRPFTAVLHPEGFTHADEIGTPGARFFTVEVAGESFERIGLRAPDDVVRDVSTGTLMRSAMRLFCAQRMGDATELSAQEFLAGAARSTSAPDTYRPAWLKRVTERLHEEFMQPLSLVELAAGAQVHPVHLSRSFQRFEGQSISSRIRNLRVQHVCQAISRDDLSLAQIAADAGFTDQSHLTRVIKQTFGVTPGQLRAAMAVPRQTIY